MWTSIHKIKQLKALDSQIWAWESGAQDVKYADENSWLNLVIYGKQLGNRYLWAPKNVTLETHEDYKSYNFIYAPIYHIAFGRIRGIVLQFKENFRVPPFSVFPIDGWRPSDEHTPLSLHVYDRNVPSQYVYAGNLDDEWEIFVFLRELQFLEAIISHPKWDQLYFKDNFVAVYYQSNLSEDYAFSKELFGMDEKIARVLLGGQLQQTDPAVEIKFLKDEEAD